VFVAHLAKESEVMRENQVLLEELKQWDGASATRHLDPTLVVPSTYANRDEGSFRSAEFKAFADEIESAGGNVQPIKVRPLAGTTPQKYEIVFGHRRHRACLERSVQLLAMIESIDDRALFQEMDRENRQRADLRPYEQGEMYRKALDNGLYPSLRAMAEALGVAPSNVSVAISIARLPGPVLDAFASRLDIQFQWGRLLDAEMKKNPTRILALAAEVTEQRSRGVVWSSTDVLAHLMSRPRAAVGAKEPIRAGDKTLGTVQTRGGKISIELDANAFPDEVLIGVLEAIRAVAK
jgi:ParB family chromosome partitioning protein